MRIPQKITALRRRLERRECPKEPISTGTPLDRLLPSGGLRPGSLVEFLGSGAGSVAILAAHAACQDGRTFIVFDRQNHFYPPAAGAWGIDLSQTLIARSADTVEELWAVDQALRCPGVGAVWLVCGRIAAHDFRRLQLAAECGGTLGLLLRPAKFRGQPTWADVRWMVEPQPSCDRRRLRVELVRCRGATTGKSMFLEFDEQAKVWVDHATHPVYSSAELAYSVQTGT